MAQLLLPLIRQRRRRVMGLRWGRPQGLVVVLLVVLLVLLLLLVLLVLLVLLLLLLVVVVVVVVLERQLVEVAHIVGVGVAKMLLVGMEAEHLLLLLERLLLLHVRMRGWGWGQGRGRVVVVVERWLLHVLLQGQGRGWGRMLLLHERLVRGWHRCHHGGRGKRGRVQR